MDRLGSKKRKRGKSVLNGGVCIFKRVSVDNAPISSALTPAPGHVFSGSSRIGSKKRNRGKGAVSRGGCFFGGVAPCLILPGKASEATRFISLDNAPMSSVLTPNLGHVILGSSNSWLVTADELARLRLVNPVTGVHHDLPDITTMGIKKRGFSYNLDIHAFMHTRFGGMQVNWGPRWELVKPRSFTLAACQMREFFYRKVVLSANPHPNKYAAMLILQRGFGAPAFATAKNSVWTLESSADSVEDAVYHDSQFFSITYSGVVQSWKHDVEACKFTSKVIEPGFFVCDKENMVEVVPRLTENYQSFKKYLVVSLDGRLLVVQKCSEEIDLQWKCSFKVHAISSEMGGVRQWEELPDIGESVLFVGLSNSMCISSKKHPEFKAGCIYFADDELEQAPWRMAQRNRYLYNGPGFNNRCFGAYNLKKGKMAKVKFPLEQRSIWPPAVWFRPFAG